MELGDRHMTITLPDEMRERVETRAKLHGYASVTEYILSLLDDEENGTENVDALSSPPELTPRSRAELEAMLDAGMNSGPPIRVTPEFWEERRRILEERMAKRKGETP